MAGRALVVFGAELPDGGFSGYDTVIAPKIWEAEVRQKGVAFTDIDTLVGPGSVQEASEYARKLSLLTTPDGRRVSKLVNYKGYELWWIHYDELYNQFCFPFTQYRALLRSLNNFDSVHLHKPPAAGLFRYFLDAHRCKYQLPEDKKFLSLGLLLQACMSVPFFLWLTVRRPRLMVWTSDQFDRGGDWDFRMKFIYEELRRKKIYFVEFIRSMEPTPTVLRHALQRKRAVVYSFAIVKLLGSLAGLFGPQRIAGLSDTKASVTADPEEAFWFLVASHYLKGLRGDRWSIEAMRLIIRCIGVRTAIIDSALGRNFHEVLACKLLNVPITGILHGYSSKDYNVYDFMPEFDGVKTLGVDKYGLWSPWWKEYYLKNGKVYNEKQLYVSGLMRPMQKTSVPAASAAKTAGPLKVLFVSEQLGVPTEMVPYLLALLEAKDLSVYVSFRSYRDGFETWLKEHRPDILEKIDPANICRSGIQECLAACDVAVGSHSTAVLEALFQLKPPVFFKSKKWGDYFELKSLGVEGSFVAESPQEFVDLIRRSSTIPQETLRQLQQRFFGDPYMNGSKWVVEEVEKLL